MRGGRSKCIGRAAVSFGPDRLIFQPAPVYKRISERDTGGVKARASGAFVGRVRELWELERALAAAQAGSGTAVLLAGDAGIGKTRLATELAARARAAGFETLVGHSRPTPPAGSRRPRPSTAGPESGASRV